MENHRKTKKENKKMSTRFQDSGVGYVRRRY